MWPMLFGEKLEWTLSKYCVKPRRLLEMRHDIAMAATTKKAAPASASHMQAYVLATKLLRKAGSKHDAAPAALNDFLAAIEADEDLMRGCALGFLQFVARDMKGGDAGRDSPDTLSIGASAPPPDRDGADQVMSDTQIVGVRPVREPSSSQKQAAAAIRRDMAESALTSMRIRDGRAIGKVWRSEISDLIGENWRENAILDRLRKIPLPRGANDARLDEYVSDGHLRRIIAEVDGSLAA